MPSAKQPSWPEKKLGIKTATKLGTKLGTKLAAKTGAGWIPFLGAAVGPGINAYFINEIGEAGKQYYLRKAAAFEFSPRLLEREPTVPLLASASAPAWRQQLAIDLATTQQQAESERTDLYELMPHLKPR